MSEMTETMDALQAERQARSRQYRSQALQDFQPARFLASKHGLRLKEYGEAHYALIGYYSNGRPRWRHNIYPGNQRIKMDDRLPEKAPYLEVTRPWTLMDVVHAAIDEERMI